MRKPLIAANWKMNKNVLEALAFIAEIKKITLKDRDAVVCPPFTALHAVGKELKGTNISLGAQNMHFEKSGAFTGEISAEMIKEAGCAYVILGHSERRDYFKETNELINKKIKAAILNGLNPILCVGEKLDEREQNKTKEIVESQLKGSLKDISKADMSEVTIAYEPVWAIGTGKTATPQQAEEVHAFLRGLIEGMYGKDISEAIRILYGGSVKPNNIKEIMGTGNIDGALVGGASLDPNSFAELVNF